MILVRAIAARELRRELHAADGCGDNERMKRAAREVLP
jgi:hypothetical protein